jgi:hypothetical protein
MKQSTKPKVRGSSHLVFLAVPASQLLGSPWETKHLDNGTCGSHSQSQAQELLGFYYHSQCKSSDFAELSPPCLAGLKKTAAIKETGVIARCPALAGSGPSIDAHLNFLETKCSFPKIKGPSPLPQ